jgi:hypothetical protein
MSRPFQFSPKIWLSAAEIAALNIEGLPSTKMGILLRAEREGWPSRAGRGGGREYRLSTVLLSIDMDAREAAFLKERGGR